MTVHELLIALSAAADHTVLISVAFLTLLQIAPIKIDPWTWLLQKIGAAANGKILEKVDALARDFSAFKLEVRERQAVEARSRITLFADELLRGEHHSKEAFEQVFADITFYRRHCESHRDFGNDITEASICSIKETYKACLTKRSFLGG